MPSVGLNIFKILVFKFFFYFIVGYYSKIRI